MLDNNTDRMWYVIGAVIVGAALILVMNLSMPELFAAVGETFEEKTEDVLAVVEGIYPQAPEPAPVNLINTSTLTMRYLIKHWSGELTDDSGGEWYATTDYMKVDPKYDYVLFAEEGLLLGVRIVFFDSNKEVVDGWYVEETTSKSVELPQDTVYVRISAMDAATGLKTSDENWTGEYDTVTHHNDWVFQREVKE